MDEMTMNLAGAAAVQPSLPDAKAPAPKPAASQTESKSVQSSDYFISPKGKIDPSSGVYVIEVRDAESGEVVNQYPKKKGAEDYRRAVEAARPAEPSASAATAPRDGGGQGSAETASPSSAPAPAESR